LFFGSLSRVVAFESICGDRNLQKHQFYLVKHRFFVNRPFPIDLHVGTKKSPKTDPKPLQNPFNTSIPKPHRKSTPKLIAFGLKMTPKMSSEIVQNSTRGALWGHTGAQEAQKGGPGSPWDPKRRSWAPLGHHFPYFLGPTLDVF